MTARTPSEKSIVDAITKYLRSHGAYVVKQHGSQYGRAGVPDLLVCHHGRFLALEVKKPVGGKVSPLQKIEIDKIRAAGGLARVVTSVEDVKALLPAVEDAKHARQAADKVTTEIARYGA